MISARNVYYVTMTLSGLALGAAARAWPSFGSGAIPPYVWLLGVSLVFDIALQALSAKRPIAPMSMNARAAGFFAGAIVYLLVTYVFAPSASEHVLAPSALAA